MADIKIDIIIPCYNSHSTIDRCIGSILAQRVAPSCKVTLVNDGGEHYDDVIKRYSPIIDIQEIGYEKNVGIGHARNFGLANTNNNTVVFMDSDDALGDPFSLINMCNQLYSANDIVICISKFMEEVAPFVMKLHEKDSSFMHGKMYRREFLEKYNIKQNENCACNEDVGFNLLALMIAKHVGYRAVYPDIIGYYWLCNPNSTVRKDKVNYDHSTSFRDFVGNLQYVYEELEKRGMDSKDILLEKTITMMRAYLLYTERTKGFPQFKEGNYNAVKKYYDAIYSKVEHKVTDSALDKVYTLLPFKGNPDVNKKAYKKFLKGLK